MAWCGRLLPLWPEGFCGRNMAAQPGKSSPTRKSSNDDKKPGYPLQRQGCVFESLSPSQPDPVLLTYCTVNVEKPNTNYLKKLKKVDLLYALFDVTDQSESFIRSKRCKIYFCLIPSLKCVRNRVPKQQMLIRCCTNYIIIVVLYSVHIQGAAGKSVSFSIGSGVLKYRLFLLKLSPVVEYCVI